MRFSIKISLIICSLVFVAFLPSSYANVWELEEESSLNYVVVSIPEDEFISFFDANGIYTVVGNVKNSEKFPIIPTILIKIQDDEKSISKSSSISFQFPILLIGQLAIYRLRK